MSGLFSWNAFSARAPSATKAGSKPSVAQHDAEHLGERGVVVDHENARFHATMVASPQS